MIRRPPRSTLFPSRRSSDLDWHLLFTRAGLVWYGGLIGGTIGSTLYLRMQRIDRKSTRLNSSHLVISYAVFCLKKKNSSRTPYPPAPPTVGRDALRTPFSQS